MADNNLKMVLDVDADLRAGRINDVALKKAIAAVLRELKLPKAQIKQEIGLTTTIPRAELRRQIDKHIEDLDAEIERGVKKRKGPGAGLEVDENLTKQAQGLRRAYSALSQSLAETTVPEDLLQDKGLKRLVDSIQRGNLSLDKVKNLTDEQLRKLREYQAALRETAKIYSSVASLSRGLGVGTGVDPVVLPQVVTTAQGLSERAKNLDIALDPARQEQRARREAREAEKNRKEAEDAQDDLERRQAELENRRRSQRLLRPFRTETDPVAAVQKLDQSLQSPFDVDTLRRFFREEPRRLGAEIEQRAAGKTVEEQRSDTKLKDLVAQYDRLRNESKLVEERLRALGKSVEKTAAQLGRERDRRNEVALRRAREVQAQGLIGQAGGLRNLRNVTDPADQRLVRSFLEDRRDRLQNVLDTRRVRGGGEENLRRTAADLEQVTKALNGVDPRRIEAAEKAQERNRREQIKDAQEARRERQKLRDLERRNTQQQEKSLERRVKASRQVDRAELDLSDRQRARSLLAPVRRAGTAEEADRRLSRLLQTPASAATVQAGLRSQLSEVDLLRRQRSVGLTETQRAQRPDIQGLDREFDKLTKELEQVRQKLRELGATSEKTEAQLRKERENRVALAQRRERDAEAQQVIQRAGGLRQVTSASFASQQEQRLVQQALQERQARLQNVVDSRRGRTSPENLRQAEDEIKRITRALGRIDSKEVVRARKEADREEKNSIREQQKLRDQANKKQEQYERGRDARVRQRLKEAEAAERNRVQQREAQRILQDAQRGASNPRELAENLRNRFSLDPASQAIFQAGITSRLKDLRPQIEQRRASLNAVQRRNDPELQALEREFADLTAAAKAGSSATQQLAASAKRAAAQTEGLTDAQKRQQKKEAAEADQLSIARARLAEGRRIVESAGGLPYVAGIRDPEDQLLARDFLQNRQNVLRDQQDQRLRDGLRGTAEFKQGHRDLLETSKALDRLNFKMSEFGDIGHQAGLTIRQFFRYAVGYGALYQMLTAVTALVGGLRDLNRELVGIQAVSTATDVEMLKVAAAIKTVALETKFTNTEIAQAAKVLAQAGVEPDKIQSALAGTANFAAATESSLEVASDLVSSMRTVFSELSDATIANQLTAAINQSKLTADDLKTIVSISAQINKSYGLSSEQFLAAATTLRNAGLKASTVATGLRQGLIEIFSPDAKTLKAIKLRYKELGEEVSDSAIRSRFLGFRNEDNPLTAVLRELDRLGFTGSGKQTFQRAFDIRAENAITALIKDLDELERAESSLASGNSAIIGSQIQLTSLQATIDNLAAAFTVLADSVAGDSLKSLQKFLAEVVEVTRALTDLNENMKESAGFGFGTSVLAGLGAGAGVFANAKGGFIRRGVLAGTAAVGATAGLTAVGKPLGESGVDVSGAVNGALTVAALTSMVMAVLRRLPGLGRKRSLDLPDTPKSGKSKVGGADGGVGATEAIQVAAAGIDIAGGVYGFFRNIAGRLGHLAPLLKRAFPWLAVASTIAGMMALLDGFETLSKDEKLRNRVKQGLKNLTSGNQEYVSLLEEASAFRLSTPDKPAAKGTEASELEDIGARLSLVDGEIEQFFGTKNEELDAVLLHLAKEGSEAGSGARRRYLARLAEVTGNDNILQLAESIGTVSDSQAKLDRKISELSGEYNAVFERSSQLRESLARTVLRLKDYGENQTAAQRALVEAYTEVDNLSFGELSSSIDIAPERVEALIRQVFEKASGAFNEVEQKLRSERLDDLKQETVALIQAAGLKNRDELEQFALSLGGEYRQLGFTFEEFITTLRDTIQLVEKQTAEEARRLKEKYNVGFKPRSDYGAGFEPREGDSTASSRSRGFLSRLFFPDQRDLDRTAPIGSPEVPEVTINVDAQADLEGPPEDSRSDAQKLLDQLVDKLELEQSERQRRELDAKQTEVLNRLDDLIRILQTETGQKILSEQAPEVKASLNLDELKTFQNDPEQLLGADGSPTKDLFTTGIEDFIKQSDDELERLRSLEAQNRDALRDIRIAAAADAKRRRANSQLADLNRQQTVADDSNDTEALRRIIKERHDAQLSLLQADLEELRAQLAASEGDDYIVQRAQLSTQIVEAESKIAEAKKEQLFEEQRYLNELRLREADQRISAIQADINLLEAQRGGDLPARARGYREGIGRQETPEQRRSDILNEIEIAQKQQQQLQIDIEKVVNDTTLSEQQRVDILKGINAQLIKQQYLLGKLQGEYDLLNADPKAQLKIAFDLDAIGERIRNLDGGFHTLGITLQDTLVKGVSDLANGLAEAVIQGEDLEDVLKNLLHTLANDIRLEIQKRVINKFLGDMFQAASGASDPSGGAGGAAQTATKLVSSALGGGSGQTGGGFFSKFFGGAGGAGATSGGTTTAGQTGGGGGFFSSLLKPLSSLFGGGGAGGAGATGGAGSSGGFFSNLFSGFSSLFGGGGGAGAAGGGGGFFSSIGSWFSGLFGGGGSAGAAGAGAGGLGALLGPIGAGLGSAALLAKGIISSPLTGLLSLFGVGGERKGVFSALPQLFGKVFGFFNKGGARIGESGKIHGPGTGTSDEILGQVLDDTGRPKGVIAVSNGESILTKKATDALGEDFINQINRQGGLPKFAVGGLVRDSHRATSTARTGSAIMTDSINRNTSDAISKSKQPIDFTNVNVVDESMFDQYVEGSQGQRTYMNFIKRNATAIKRILS